MGGVGGGEVGGGLGTKEGSGVFEDGADTPMHTMEHLALKGGQNIK